MSTLWSPAEDAYLRGLWRDPERRHQQRMVLASEVLGRSLWSIYHRASFLGLVRPWVSSSDARRWRDRAAAGETASRIARSEGRPETTIRNHLTRRGATGAEPRGSSVGSPAPER